MFTGLYVFRSLLDAEIVFASLLLLRSFDGNATSVRLNGARAAWIRYLPIIALAEQRNARSTEVACHGVLGVWHRSLCNDTLIWPERNRLLGHDVVAVLPRLIDVLGG